MARAKAKSVEEVLSLEKLIEYLNGQGIKAFKVNELTVKLPYAWGTELELPATDKALVILNAYHAPIKLKAKA